MDDGTGLAVDASAARTSAGPLQVLTASGVLAAALVARLEAAGRTVQVVEVVASGLPQRLGEAAGLVLAPLDAAVAVRPAPDTPLGDALRDAAAAGTPVLGAYVAGESVRRGASDAEASYRERLSVVLGAALLDGTVIVTQAHGHDRDLWENDAAG